MINSLPRCNQCNSPVTDSIEVEIENHGKIKLGKNVQGSWICNDCEFSHTPEIQDESNSRVRHEHIGVANKADVSPNTPTGEEADPKPDSC
jgi:Zn-finger protein